MTHIYKHQEGKFSYAVNCISGCDSADKPNIQKYVMNTERVTLSYSGNVVVRFTKTDINLNNTKIHTPIQEMLLCVDTLMHDIELEITKKGDIVKVKNYNNIRTLWEKELRMVFSETYQGIYAEAMVDHVDRLISTPENFLAALVDDLFLYYYLCVYKGAGTTVLRTLGQAPVEAEVRYDENDKGTSLFFEISEQAKVLLDAEYTQKYGAGTTQVTAKADYIFENNTLQSINAQISTLFADKAVSSLQFNANLIK